MSKSSKPLKKGNNAFKSGDKILIQTSKDFIPATYIKKTTNAHQVKITKTMMGLRAGDIIEIVKGIIPALREAKRLKKRHKIKF